MGTEAFYSTAAQVRPTLLIALVVQMSTLPRAWAEREIMRKRAHAAPPGEVTPKQEDQIRRSVLPDSVFGQKRWVRKAITAIGVIFLLGEATALAVLLFDASEAFTYSAGPLALLAMLALSAVVLAVEVYRLRL
jgi:hypothetical protein